MPVRAAASGEEVLDILDRARERLACASDPVPCAVATIVSAQGSVPRPVGTSMLVGADGELHGSLSGGCVEGAVLEACREALETGRSSVRSFGFSEEDAFAVGLMCGGSLEVLIQPFAPPPPGAQSPLGTVDDPAPAAYVTRLPHGSEAPRTVAPEGDDARRPARGEGDGEPFFGDMFPRWSRSASSRVVRGSTVRSCG